MVTRNFARKRSTTRGVQDDEERRDSKPQNDAVGDGDALSGDSGSGDSGGDSGGDGCRRLVIGVARLQPQRQ